VSELVWRILSAAPLVGLAWLTVRIVKRANEPQRGFNTDVVWSRIGAHLLDWILIGVAWICGMASTYQLSISLGFTDSTRLVWDNTLGNTGLFAIAIGDIVLLQAATGYTWGKRILRIRTVNSDGCRPGLRATIIRSVPLIIEQFGIVALFAMARSGPAPALRRPLGAHVSRQRQPASSRRGTALLTRKAKWLRANSQGCDQRNRTDGWRDAAKALRRSAVPAC
jgi:uncharacterized RDD family membrane protein YckC